MNLKVKAILLAALCVAPAIAQSNTAANADAPEAKVYAWLCQQQGAHGILGNQDRDDFAGLYPNAMAAMAFVHQGDLARAEKVLDYYNLRYAAEFAEGKVGGFPQAANSATGELLADTDRWIGDNAWLLLALNYHKQVTKQSKYDPMRQAIGQWLVSLQDDNGGVKAGFNRDGPMLHYSTEGNLDCYAALIDFPTQRARVLKFLTTEMYVSEGPHFRMGSTVSEPALDTCAWGIAALGADYAKLLPPAEKRFKRTDVSEATGNPVTGFADFVDKKRVWLEGTGEMAVAYNVAGRPEDAKTLLAELEKAMVSSESHAGTLGIPCSTTEPAWTGATTRPFTPSQVWYLFAKWNFNPMITK